MSIPISKLTTLPIAVTVVDDTPSRSSKSSIALAATLDAVHPARLVHAVMEFRGTLRAGGVGAVGLLEFTSVGGGGGGACGCICASSAPLAASSVPTPYVPVPVPASAASSSVGFSSSASSYKYAPHTCSSASGPTPVPPFPSARPATSSAASVPSSSAASSTCVPSSAPAYNSAPASSAPSSYPSTSATAPSSAHAPFPSPDPAPSPYMVQVYVSPSVSCSIFMVFIISSEKSYFMLPRAFHLQTLSWYRRQCCRQHLMPYILFMVFTLPCVVVGTNEATIIIFLLRRDPPQSPVSNASHLWSLPRTNYRNYRIRAVWVQRLRYCYDLQRHWKVFRHSGTGWQKNGAVPLSILLRVILFSVVFGLYRIIVATHVPSSMALPAHMSIRAAAAEEGRVISIEFGVPTWVDSLQDASTELPTRHDSLTMLREWVGSCSIQLDLDTHRHVAEAENRPKSQHRYNVQEQHTKYNQEILRIWND
ncbi:hypothetical protein JB92DRAFT_3214188 [Gautieria morchelliformis]|nr:hypothetical protein JB92DRAFT_3214188 [Gautieria morchelliformis]